MRTFKSKTGYIKCKVDGVIYEASVIYLGKYDKEENYIEVTKEEYDKYQEESHKEVENANR